MKSKAIIYTLEELARRLGGRFKGQGSLRISGVAPLGMAREGQITFLTNAKYAKALPGSRASALLCDAEPPGSGEKALLIVPNPYAALAQVISLFHPPVKPKPGLRKGAFVEKSAKVHRTACVMPGAAVSAGARIGARTILHPGVFVGEGTVVGEDCLFHPNVVVREGCEIGNRVILQPGVVVGGDGFGFAPSKEGYRKIPQVGNVVIEDDVELGANTCVDRAVLGTTRIGRGAKLDNLVQVGHNCEIGANTVIAGQAALAGSVVVGSWVVIGGQAAVAGHLKVGDRVTLAARTGVMEDLLEPGVYWGSPSSPMSAEMKNVAAYRELPELAKRIRRLEKALEKLDPQNGNKGRPL